LSCKVSIIISAFQRPHLLKWNLFSISRQSIPWDYEVLVINDGTPDETEQVCREYQKIMNLKYIFSGQRNSQAEIKWRVPGFAYNIGARLSCGDILIICCAEMFHINDTISYLVQPLLNNSKLIGMPVVKDDKNAAFLQYVIDNGGSFDMKIFDSNKYYLNARNPFLISVHSDEFFAIGGYDEDFTGIAWDDNDFASRLKHNGCNYQQTKASTIHLYHRRFAAGKRNYPEYCYNEKLYRERSGQIVRNQGREWGKIPGS